MPGLLVGVTCTRYGLTEAQARAWWAFLTLYDVAECHHGDCVGGDADAATLAAAVAGLVTVSHPPTNPKLRAYHASTRVLEPEPYAARNRAIVLATSVLVAFPRTAAEQTYGGTWQTVRFARGKGRPILVVNPDGGVQRERTHGMYFGL